MTWAEFKAEVDRQLKEKDIKEDTRIRFIDVSYSDTIRVFLDVELLAILDG